jgi:hypothetical protein
MRYLTRKAFPIFAAVAAMFYMAGCLEEPVFQPDHPAGRTLVVYWGENRDTKRAAYLIARRAGAALFDIAGKERFPDPLGFDNFFIGTPVEDGAVPAAVGAFLADTDFIDGYAALFRTSRKGGGMEGGSPVLPVKGARLMGERDLSDVNRMNADALEEAAGPWAESVLAELASLCTVGLRAEYVIKAFAHAYPERITEAAFRDGDWAFRMDDVWYCYAGGRIIPEDERGNPEKWMSQSIYRYSPESPNEPAEEGPMSARLEISRRFQFTSNRGGRGPTNSNAARYPFHEKLLETQNYDEAYRSQRRVPFFGYPVTVHRIIAEPLARVEKRILKEAETDEEVSAWLKSVYSITGWNWRNIAGSDRLSYHAYGIAVDLQMQPRPGMETYWQWTAAKGIDWRSVPRENRLEPPDRVVRIFEENGFIWGGKWSWYDTMHFEYRPEVLLLSF